MAVETFDERQTQRTLFTALLDARDRYGAGKLAVEDPERAPLSYDRLTLASLIIGDKLATNTRPGEAIGVLLPNVQGVAAVIFGISAFGRVPAMLNFTAGLRNLRAALKTAQITKIATSRRFIETAQIGDIVAALASGERQGDDRERQPVEIIYLEDVRAKIGLGAKILGKLRSLRARAFHRKFKVDPNSPGVILFTSGSEGVPKGVVLSHANLIANALQIAAHDGGGILLPSDIVMNPLPVFHSYGLTGGLLLGLLNGMKVVLYPSPLHYKQIPELIRATKSTILFGTDTFLRGYSRAAAPGDLDSVRLVVAGAEKVKDDTRQSWSKSGTVIIEGYGATECSPVIAVNSPRDNRAGTVGWLLPGIDYELLPVEGIETGGRLRVRGPNVMRGYMFHDRPGELVPLTDGWHDTGDIVGVDGDGFVTILGRAKRFAKIGGEMVSHAAVENMVSQLWPDANHVVVTLPDPKKGEQLVLVTDKPDAERGALLAHARAQGFPELWVPRAILSVESIPVLGSGKLDFVATQKLARQMRPPV